MLALARSSNGVWLRLTAQSTDTKREENQCRRVVALMK